MYFKRHVHIYVQNFLGGHTRNFKMVINGEQDVHFKKKNSLLFTIFLKFLNNKHVLFYEFLKESKSKRLLVQVL